MRESLMSMRFTLTVQICLLQPCFPMIRQNISTYLHRPVELPFSVMSDHVDLVLQATSTSNLVRHTSNRHDRCL